MLSTFSEPTLVACVGLFGGILLGLAARIGRFCTLGAIEDVYYGASTLRLRMWGIAIGVAVIGTFGLSALNLLNLGETLALSRLWNPIASIVGGLLFGYGMALAGNCGYGALARLGGGDLRSFVIVLVMGLAAYITLGGPLSDWRILIFGGREDTTSTQGFAGILSDWTALPAEPIGILIGILILAATLANRTLLQSPKYIFWGAAHSSAASSKGISAGKPAKTRANYVARYLARRSWAWAQSFLLDAALARDYPRSPHWRSAHRLHWLQSWPVLQLDCAN